MFFLSNWSKTIVLAVCLPLTVCGGSGTSKTTSITTSAAATPTPTPTPTHKPNAAECPFGDYKSALVSAVNAMRANTQVCGGVLYPAVRALGWSSQLESAATFHSNDMAVNNFVDHPGSNGQRIGARTTAAGYSYSKVGENIAAGQTSASQAVSDWLASPSHCANIMTALFVDMGASCKYSTDSTNQYYWTLVMANR